MKFLCLAYGHEDGWHTLSEEERRLALAQDAVIRDRGNLMAAVRGAVTSVRNWQGTPEISEEAIADPALPLAGFSVIEADDVTEVIRLVADTPCARAHGVIEIRALWDPADGSPADA